MSEPTMSVLIREWDDDPEDGQTADVWPYPTHHMQYRITGELADRVRSRLGAHVSDTVLITEDRVSGGYSEYTQEDELFFEVECGDRKVSFDEWSPRVEWGSTTVARLAAWLADTDEPKDSITFNTDDLGPATDIDGNPLADTDEGNER